MSNLFDALDDVEEPQDLFQIFLKPVAEMTDEELAETYEKVQARRKKKLPRTKQPDELDLILKRMSPEMAAIVLKKMEEQSAEEENKEGEVEE